MLRQSGKQPFPCWERCSQIAVDAGLPKLEFDARNVELWGMCDNFFVVVDGIRGAGANPTRAGWPQAVQRLGPRSSIVYGPSEFRSGKVTGSDQVHTLEWQRACACYKSVSAFDRPPPERAPRRTGLEPLITRKISSRLPMTELPRTH